MGIKNFTVNKSKQEITIVLSTHGNTPDDWPESKSGKSLVVATTGGFEKVFSKELGLGLMVGINVTHKEK
tara:strand:+ start:471 stop:680 length:210 start_codon:yes stop_codon:yes gene_type:complete